MSTVRARPNQLPIRDDITVSQGASFRERYTLAIQSTSDELVVDLTGATLTLVVSDKRGGTAKAFSASTAATADYPSLGYFTVVVDSTDTDTWGEGRYWYQVNAAFPSSNANFPDDTLCILEGFLTVKEDAIGA